MRSRCFVFFCVLSLPGVGFKYSRCIARDPLLPSGWCGSVVSCLLRGERLFFVFGGYSSRGLTISTVSAVDGPDFVV